MIVIYKHKKMERSRLWNCAKRKWNASDYWNARSANGTRWNAL